MTMNMMKYKIWYLVFSAVLLIPGIISLVTHGLNLAIDFTGGSVFEYSFVNVPNLNDLKSIYQNNDVTIENITSADNNKWIVRTKSVDPALGTKIKDAVTKKFDSANGDAKLLSFETVGPTIGAETTKSAFVSLGWASLGILLYIAYAFRNIPKPYSSLRFGASAVIAMLHDALMVLGIFSILGHFKGTEIDALFITAILTVIGFSVHDTIVVFDRIRENLLKLPRSLNFEYIVNYSVVETLNRSLATSLTVIFTLSALYLLGGLSIKNFTLALLIGIVSGTYSSIFTASPILVLWENYIANKNKKSK
jgi:preprotein translocase subunit SecF